MAVSEIKLYELLKAKIGEREAEAFIQIIEDEVENRSNKNAASFITNKDLRILI